MPIIARVPDGCTSLPFLTQICLEGQMPERMMSAKEVYRECLDEMRQKLAEHRRGLIEPGADIGHHQIWVEFYESSISSVEKLMLELSKCAD